MIKLIVSDMDGTLLTSEHKLPEDLFPLIDELGKKKVKFAVATGRPYYNLVNFYKERAKEMLFISDNGALVIDKGEVIYENSISFDNVSKLVSAIKETDNAFPVVCTKDAYLIQEDYTEHFKRFANDSTPINYKIVKCLIEAVKDEKVLKIGIFDLNGAEENSVKKLAPFKNDFAIVASGKHWVDIMNIDINKGVAIKMLQAKYNISTDETMVFGDYLNDFEMISNAKYSYAMANGHDKIKEAANFEAPSNDDHGVVVVIKEYLNMM